MSESSKEHTAGMLMGLVLVVVGLVLLGEKYDWFGLNIDIGLDKVWPVFLIIAGIYFILTHKRG
jgi:hypothetical protein